MRPLILALLLALPGCKIEPEIKVELYSNYLVLCDLRTNQAWYVSPQSDNKVRAQEYDYLCTPKEPKDFKPHCKYCRWKESK